MGISSLPIKLPGESVLAVGANSETNVEISLMLDVTGSMDGQKIDDLKDAAKDLVDIVVWNDQSQYTSKVALAPFSRASTSAATCKQVTTVQATRDSAATSSPASRASPSARDRSIHRRGARRQQYSAAPTCGDKGNAAKDNQDNYSTSGDCTSGGWDSPRSRRSCR